MRRIACFAIYLMLICWTFFPIATGHTSPFLEVLKNDARIMVAFKDVGKAGDFIEYAENILKQAVKQHDGKIMNPEIMKKVKEDKLLWQAIQDGNATAMAKISTDYGARILIRGSLSVDSRQKFGVSWEGTASLTLSAIDTTTAEEISNVTSTPFGLISNPAPIEDSPLIAKQIAVKRVCDDIIVKLGMGSEMSDLKGASTFSFEMYDIFKISSGVPTAIRFLSDSHYVAVAAGNAVEILGLYEKSFTSRYKIESGKVTSLAGSPDGAFLAIGDSKGYVHCVNVGEAAKKYKVRLHKGAVTALSFKPDSTVIASAGNDNKIHLLNAVNGFYLGVLKGHKKRVNSITFTPNGRHLISASNDLSIRWWDINVARQKKALQESADKLLCMTLSQDGNIVALSTVDIHINMLRRQRRDVRHIKVRNTATGEEIRVLEGHKKDVTTLSFHPAKRFLASGSVDNTIRIWDLQTGDVMNYLNLKEDIISVDFSKDGKWFAALTRDQKLTVWKLR